VTAFKILKYSIITILVLFTFFIIKSFYEQKRDINEIKKYPAFTDGIIIEYTHSGISGRYYQYDYYVNNIKYVNDAGTDNPLDCENIGYSNCEGEKYKVIYSKKNPQNSYLLTERYSYELFNLKVPQELLR